MDRPNKNKLICHCFDYSVNDIEADAITNGRSLTIIKYIIRYKRLTPEQEAIAVHADKPILWWA